MAVLTFDLPSARTPQVPAAPVSAKAITPSDADTYERPVGVYVGGAGSVVVSPAGGQADVTFASVPAGSVLPVLVRAVKATGTTATGLIAVY